jgi:hypothetical protein
MRGRSGLGGKFTLIFEYPLYGGRAWSMDWADSVCRQIWGFATVAGERWLVRKFAIRRKDKDEVVRIRLCYEWAGELDS